MYAVLYTGVATLERLLKQGADPNKRNDANATALIWAATDLEKTRLLLEHKADVNARSSDMRTPLMIAARRPGNAPLVKLLLDRGANPNPNRESRYRIVAADRGRQLRRRRRRGTAARPRSRCEGRRAAGADHGCRRCSARNASLCSLPKTSTRRHTAVTLPDTAFLGDVNAVRVMLDHGADVNAFDPLGRTPLMYAAGSDLLPVDVVKLLIERGADVNAKDTAQARRRCRPDRARYRQASRQYADCRTIGQDRAPRARPPAHRL